MVGTQTSFPYDIYFPTTAEDCKDADGRMHITCRRSRDSSSREVCMLYDNLGNASRMMKLPRTRGCSYPAAALIFDRNGGLGTISIGPSEHVAMDKYLVRASRSDR
jgi:hypothetical protein